MGHVGPRYHIAPIFTGIVSTLKIWKIVYVVPGLRIGPIYQYIPIFGILTILGTVPTEIV